MAKKSGRHKMRLVQTQMPMMMQPTYPPTYPYYPPQQKVVYMERPSKTVHKKKHKVAKQPKKEKDLFEMYESEVNALFPEELDEEVSKGKHKLKEKDLFESYEDEMNALYPPLEEEEDYEEEEVEEPRRKGKHKVKKQKDMLEAYKREIEVLAPEPAPSVGIHKISPEEQPLPLFAEPEELPAEESEEDWLKRQQKQYEQQAEEFKRLAESGKKFALGTYQTFEKAKRSARRFSRGLKSAYYGLREKLGMKVPPKTPVQVFVEPTEEGDYVVYGQVTKKEVPVTRPAKPIKIYEAEPLKADEYVKYEELM